MSETQLVKIAIEPTDEGVFLSDISGMLNGSLNLFVKDAANVSRVLCRAVAYLLKHNHEDKRIECIQIFNELDPIEVRVTFDLMALPDTTNTEVER